VPSRVAGGSGYNFPEAMIKVNFYADFEPFEIKKSLYLINAIKFYFCEKLKED
jgi:hypothetical protein